MSSEASAGVYLKATIIVVGVLVCIFAASNYANAFFPSISSYSIPCILRFPSPCSNPPTLPTPPFAPYPIDLSIYVSGPATIVRGGVIIYNITVTNNGPNPTVWGYSIGDTIPTGVTFNAASSSSTCAPYPGRSDLITCTESSTLTVGGVKSFTVAFNVPNTIACNSIIENVAAVGSLINESNTANNHSSLVQGPVRTTVICQPVCTSHASKICAGNVSYWYDSCGNQQEVYQVCNSNQTCSNGSCVNQNITCSCNSDCGTSAHTGSPFCQGNNVYKNYITYTCNNPGTSSSTCSNSTAAQLITTCTPNQTCTNGSCTNQNITCSSSSDCGTNAYTGSPFCQSGSVYQNYITYTCNNPGTANSYCSNLTNSQLKTTCTGNQTCLNGSCSGQNCTYHSYQQCSGNYLYWYDSCGNQQDSQYCQNGCYNNYCQNYNNCTYHSYKQCVGNNLYWYDSCGTQQDLYQYCQNGCYNNSCSGYYNNNCTYHAYKLCSGNNVYWYDSCGTQQDLYQTCSGANQTCQYGQCAYQQPVNPYISHYRIACYGKNQYWYDSLGSVNALYKNCADSNSCTLDSCSASKCSNVLKCDGTTCTVGSEDYNSYCAATHCGNGTCEANLGETSANCAGDCKTTPNITGLSVSFFTKQDINSNQWQKTVQVGQNSQIYFMISVANNGSSQIDNVSVSTNIPNEVASLGNLQVNGVLISGDIVSGVNIGSLAPGTAKTITFEGKTQTFSMQGTKQAIATTNVSGSTQSDSVSVDLNPGQVAGAAVSSTSATTGFWAFLKRWYLWILVGLVLIFLFVVVYRRLSSNA